MNRRDFLKVAGLTALTFSGCSNFPSEEVAKYLRKTRTREENITKIYGELPNHLLVFNTLSEVIFPYPKIDDDDLVLLNFDLEFDKKMELKGKGAGIVLGGKMVTLAHIINMYTSPKKAVFGKPNKIVEKYVSPTVFSREVFLNNTLLQEIRLNNEDDIAVYTLPEGLRFSDFPAKASENVKLGEEVFLIGTPLMLTSNTRRGYVSDLDGIKGFNPPFKDEKTFFGTDITLYRGDSGCPVVNSNLELLGIGSFVLADTNNNSGLGYFKRIGEFLKYTK